MRDIKFRVWTGEKIVSNEIGLVGANGFLEFIVFHTGYQDSDEWKAYKFMQYTGLKDKNGVEIYEGDILSTSNKDKQPTITFVVFEDFGWYENFISGPLNYLVKCFKFTNANTLTSEVIGNIYEHPHLLEATQ